MKTILNASSVFTFVFILLAISACAPSSLTKDISIETEADPKANFKGYNTYKWIGSSEIINDPMGQWEPPGFNADAEIKFIIDRELRAKGMSEAAHKPDVLIGYAAGINMANIEFKANPEKQFKSLELAPKGALAILLVDADTGVIIWAGTARADVQQNKDADMKKRLDYAVTTLLGKLPK